MKLLKAFLTFAYTLVCLLGFGAGAIVVRDDVPDTKYRVPENAFPALAELPDEGQGVLIAAQWVVTAAHAVTGRSIREVTIHGIPRSVESVIPHPGYKKPPAALNSGDAAPLMAFQETSDDVALIKLSHPVEDVVPVPLYEKHDELGQMVEIFGRGATGNGVVGQYPNSLHRGELRHAYSTVISASGRWLGLRFEAPPKALPLEGMPADGDSGGPILIKQGGAWRLAGLVSRKYATGELSKFRCCLYGQITYQARISYYAAWIRKTAGLNE